MPPHCFKRSLLRSTAYLATDCALAAALYCAVSYADGLAMPLAARVLLWALYTLLQGTVCTGIWVVAHECGHGAFSDVRARNAQTCRHSACAHALTRVVTSDTRSMSW